MLNSNEDLKAFERRLTEIITCYQPQTKRWRIILMIATLSTAFTAFRWLNDPQTSKVSLLESLNSHSFFTFNYIGMILLFIFGIHRRVVAPAIIVSRIRQVLENFNLSCDQNGRLILKSPESWRCTPRKDSNYTLQNTSRDNQLRGDGLNIDGMNIDLSDLL